MLLYSNLLGSRFNLVRIGIVRTNTVNNRSLLIHKEIKNQQVDIIINSPPMDNKKVSFIAVTHQKRPAAAAAGQSRESGSHIQL